MFHQNLQTFVAGKGLSNDQVEELKKSRARQNAFVNKVRRDTIDYWDLEGTPDLTRKRVVPTAARSRGDVVQQVVSGFASAATTKETEASSKKDEEADEEGEGEDTKRRSEFIASLIDLYPPITETGVFLYIHDNGDDDELIVAPEELNTKWGGDFLAHYRPDNGAPKAKKD
jgi:hypothetical protein